MTEGIIISIITSVLSFFGTVISALLNYRAEKQKQASVFATPNDLSVQTQQIQHKKISLRVLVLLCFIVFTLISLTVLILLHYRANVLPERLMLPHKAPPIIIGGKQVSGLVWISNDMGVYVFDNNYNSSVENSAIGSVNSGEWYYTFSYESEYDNDRIAILYPIDGGRVGYVARRFIGRWDIYC